MLSFKIIGLLILENYTFKVFTIYGRGCHIGHVTLTIYINFHSPFPMRLHIKFGFDWPSGFKGKDDDNDDDDDDDDEKNDHNGRRTMGIL